MAVCQDELKSSIFASKVMMIGQHIFVTSIAGISASACYDTRSNAGFDEMAVFDVVSDDNLLTRHISFIALTKLSRLKPY